jgi:hypothetical protein
MCAVIVFLRSVFVNGADIWEACMMAFTADALVLKHSPLVIVYRKDSHIFSRTLIHSDPKTGVWGITPICPNDDCSTQPGDVYSKTHKVRSIQAHALASWACKRCGGKSDQFGRPEWVREVPHKLNYFFYDFPFQQMADVVAKERKWTLPISK